MFASLTNGYDDLWKAIIRPPRDAEYSLQDLGPQQFKVQGVLIKRQDFQITNKRNQKIECSLYEPVHRPCTELPCVVYLHGNSSSRVECLPSIDVLLPQQIQLCCFDFSGSGKSDGEYISLGWYERDDVDVVVQYLRDSGKVSTIGLWGRSMGAVTALMHADRDPSIAGLVLDSPFSNLKTLAEELAKQYAQKMPSFVLSGAISMIRKTVQTKAQFDIEKLDPLKNHVGNAFIPAFFIAGDQDIFINPHHTKKLHEAYAGDKNISIVPGDHNSRRPSYVMNSIAIFFYNTLQVKQLVPEYHPPENGNDNVQEFKAPIKNTYNFGPNDQYVDEDEELRLAIEASLKVTEPHKPEIDNKPPVQPYQNNKKDDLMNFSDDEGLL